MMTQLLQPIEIIAQPLPEVTHLIELLLRCAKREPDPQEVKVAPCIIITQRITSMVVTVLSVPKFQLELVLHSLSSTKNNPILQLLCMVMVPQTRDKLLKPQTWQLFGNSHVSSCARITCTVWVQPITEPPPTPITTLEVIRFQDLNVMHKIYCLSVNQ